MTKLLVGETKPRKMVGANVAVTLGVICLVLIAGMVGVMAYNVTTMNNKDAEVASLNQTIDSLDATIAQQNNTIADKNSTINDLNGTINDLGRIQIIYNVWASDTRPSNGTPYFFVYGTVLNIGNETAYNCRIHVTAYQGVADERLAINSDITLGTIYGQSLFQLVQGYDGADVINLGVKNRIIPNPSWATINTSLPYSGDVITGWGLSQPEWTTTP